MISSIFHQHRIIFSRNKNAKFKMMCSHFSLYTVYTYALPSIKIDQKYFWILDWKAKVFSFISHSNVFPVSSSLTKWSSYRVRKMPAISKMRLKEKKREKFRNIRVNHIANFKYSYCLWKCCWAAAATGMLFGLNPSLVSFQRLQEKSIRRCSTGEGFHMCV